jgi:hypothetical protein
VGNATLIIEPGVEVRLLPDVSIHLEPGARLMALGQPAQGVTFVNHDFDRWNGIYGDTDSSIVLEHTEVRGGGANGTLLYSKEGTLTICHARIIENGGITLAIDSQVDVAHTEIAANDIPFGAALNVHYNRGNAVTITSNRIGGNRLQNGASSVQVINFSPLEGVGLDIQGNLMRGGQNANLLVSTSGPIYGVIACNALIGDTLGLKLRTQTEQVPPPDLRITDNIINEHTPVIEPIYLDFGIGRGAASEVALDMSRNWWGEASGPYHPEKNPEGRGDSVGNNISYEPWLDTAPLCVPPQ